LNETNIKIKFGSNLTSPLAIIPAPYAMVWRSRLTAKTLIEAMTMTNGVRLKMESIFPNCSQFHINILRAALLR
jgi:hypothetical protein